MDHHADRAAGPPLAHHFATRRQQADSVRLGMWLFLATEVLLFGGLFSAYAVYRANHPEVFVYAHRFLDAPLGALNTFILITSSLTMAWAVRSAQLGNRRLLVLLLAATIVLGCAFLGVKAIEYEHKWKHGLLWGKHYKPQHAGGAAESAAGPPGAVPQAPAPVPGEERSTNPASAIGPRGLAPEAEEKAQHGHALLEEPKNVQTFFGVYFAMTGLHGLHVVIGLGVIGWILAGARKGRYGPGYSTPVDAAGLYWHLVDLIWIFLFPMLYLIH